MASPVISVGLISDTHGLVRPEALDTLQGSDLIVHAGDIGAQRVLDALAELAPVHAVRGNVDQGAWARDLPSALKVPAGNIRLYVIHRLQDMAIDPAAQGFAAVIAGHSHVPRIEDRDGVLYINPGSAGPRRFSLPTAVGVLRVENGQASAQIIRLDS